MGETWTIQRVLDWTTGYLGRKGEERPRLSAEWLLSYVTGLSRVELYTNFDRPLDREELTEMHAAVARRAQGEPLQYVTGEMPFRHIVLRCEPGVLIPRPETEILVDAALEGVDAAPEEGYVPEGYDPDPVPVARVSDTLGTDAPGDDADEKDDGEAEVDAGANAEPKPAAGSEEPSAPPEPLTRGPLVLDLCTGTGCIALSIAGERPATRVVATDLSPTAVALARRNRDALDLTDRVEVLECDLASAVDPRLAGHFSVVVSNPPYIPTEVLEREVPAEVKDFEPHLALDGGMDGLDIFRRILAGAPSLLAPGGMLCVELFEGSLVQAADLARKQGGWARVEVREDLTHRPRVLVCVREA